MNATRPEEQTVIDAAFPVDSAVDTVNHSSWLEEPGGVVSVLPLDGEPLLSGASPSNDMPLPTGPRALGGKTEKPDPNADAGKLIGTYEVVRELGRGGMGVVYEALSTTLKKRVALKVLLKGASGGHVERFKVEGQAVARLCHPNIVGVLEQGQGRDGVWYMAMDLVEGEPMIDRVARGPIPPREAAEQAYLLAEALAYAHEQQVLHRDLKPHNVLLEPDGTPKLTDFGLAKLTGDDRGNTLTRSGEILGTPCYMAPEQIRAERGRIDERTDVYGLGATIYHMLTGSVPFDGRSVTTVFAKIINDAPRSPREAVPEIPKDLETIVLKCLEKDPAERYPGARALARDLSRFLKDLDIVAQRVRGVRRAQRWADHNRATIGVLGGTLGVLALIGAYAVSEVSSARAENGRLMAARELEAEERDAEIARIREELAQTTLIPVSATQSKDRVKTPSDQPPPARRTSTATLLDRTAEAPAIHEQLTEPKPSRGSSPQAEVPGWLVARAEQVDGSSGLVIARSLDDAKAEAMARNVPVVVVVVGTHAGQTEAPSVFTYPRAVQLLRNGGVVVVAGGFHARQSRQQTLPRDQGDGGSVYAAAPPERGGSPNTRHQRGGSAPPGAGPPPPGGGLPPPPRGGRPPLRGDGHPPPRGGFPPRQHQAGPDDRRMEWAPEDSCPVFKTISCRTHMNVSDALSRRGISLKAPAQGRARFHLLKPDGTGHKALTSASTKSLRNGLRDMQRRLGEARLEARDLDRFAPYLTGRREDPRNLRVLKAQMAEVRAGATLPAPIGPLVRKHLSRLCARGIGFISKSPHSDAKKRALFASFRAESSDDLDSLARIDEALEQHARRR